MVVKKNSHNIFSSFEFDLGKIQMLTYNLGSKHSTNLVAIATHKMQCFYCCSASFNHSESEKFGILEIEMLILINALITDNGYFSNISRVVTH